MSRARIVQHSFGTPGSGGPIGALERILGSSLSCEYEFLRLHQTRAFSGIDIGTIRGWATWLRKEDPDLIHVRGLGNEAFHAVAAAKFAGVPRILVSIHGTNRDVGMAGRTHSLRPAVVAHTLEPLTLREATHIAAVCDYAAARPFVQRHRRKFVGVVPNGVDIPPPRETLGRLREELDIPQQAFVIAWVGRVVADKGIYDLLEALATFPSYLAGRPVCLIVAGDGPNLEGVRQDFEKRTVIDVKILGLRRDILRILAESDLFVLPSHHENLSNSLLEAMASGVPVVATHVGGTPEVVAGTGVLVPPQAPEALGKAIAQMIIDPRRLEVYSKAGRRRIEDRFSLERMLSGWRQVYERVLAE